MSKIIVIDDDREVRLSIRTALESVGHDVVDCANAADGISTIKDNIFGAAIVDLILPDIYGLEMIGEMR
ncbi:MAG: response regulator, partial [Rhodospirillaceae bacterium]|nr:response regulator [Rhodospirillaceae bacterium]